MKPTLCECSGPGWCARHHCEKPLPLYEMCQRSCDLFALWERGQGPCFTLPTDEATPSAAGDGPSLLQAVGNFGTAVMRHALDGGQKVSNELRAARLTICRSCPSCDRERMVCREPQCGCYLETKAGWRSERCPLDKWPDATNS